MPDLCFLHMLFVSYINYVSTNEGVKDAVRIFPNMLQLQRSAVSDRDEVRAPKHM